MRARRSSWREEERELARVAEMKTWEEAAAALRRSAAESAAAAAAESAAAADLARVTAKETARHEAELREELAAAHAALELEREATRASDEKLRLAEEQSEAREGFVSTAHSLLTRLFARL